MYFYWPKTRSLNLRIVEGMKVQSFAKLWIRIRKDVEAAEKWLCVSIGGNIAKSALKNPKSKGVFITLALWVSYHWTTKNLSLKCDNIIFWDSGYSAVLRCTPKCGAHSKLGDKAWYDGDDGAAHESRREWGVLVVMVMPSYRNLTCNLFCVILR